ncbi:MULTISPECIES: macro domain-containing protein [unclassified Streptomyces]|uniref:macro domain-containing protein n=1 Tax=unclassified Streptomyces TaxID=2593676 RepID=UPI0033A2F4D3
MRRVGVVRLRALHLPVLEATAALLGLLRTPETRVSSLERLLTAAVTAVDGEKLRRSAAYSLGLTEDTRDLMAADRRRRAAAVHHVSVERFRKWQELMALGEVAEQIVRMNGEARERQAATHTGADGALLPTAHRAVPVVAGGRRATIRLHVHAVDLLRDVDVVVSPANTFLALPPVFKASVAAAVRRAGSLRDRSGGLLEDRIHDELSGWLDRHSSPGRAVPAGTVAATGSGALAAAGIRRVYHAAVVVPRPGTNDYDIEPSDITRAAATALDLLAEEATRFVPPLRSICFPLLGAGRGGLPPEVSLGALWTALEAELSRRPEREIHLVVRRPDRADLVERLLRSARASPPWSTPAAPHRPEQP